jgi:capsular exopolysaccharide synthesis family protein
MTVGDELNLRDFFAVFRRRRKEFGLCWGLVVASVWIYTLCITPLYRAQVTFRVAMSDDSARPMDVSALSVLAGPVNTFNPDDLLSPQILEEGVRRIAQGRTLTDHEIAVKVEALQKQASVQTADKEHQLVSFSIVSPHGKQAANEANQLAEVMVEQVTVDATAKAHKTKQFIEQQLQETDTRLRDSEDRVRHYQEKFGAKSAGNMIAEHVMELRNKRSQLSRKYTSAHPEMQELNFEIAHLEKELQVMPQQEIDIARVAREVRLNEELFTMLTKRLEEANIVESARVAPITIVDPAIEPVKPEYPNKRFNFIAGLVLGLFVGLIAVLAREHLDTSMVTTEEIEAYLQLPVLATIPHIDRRKPGEASDIGIIRKRDRLGEARSRMIFNFGHQSQYAEVYHILRNNLMRNMKPNESHVFLFTSAVVAEGKSLTAANFAIAAAQAGIPTLLAEADLRKPMVDKLFALPQEPGLTNYFYMSPRWESYLCDWEKVKAHLKPDESQINDNGLSNLHILTSGKTPPNPVSLLSSERFVHLIQDMRKRFRLVVLDGAPSMLFADSAILGSHVDGVILVYRFGRTPREVLSRAHTQLASSNAKILGVVVNDIMTGSAPDNNYYSQYGYYAYGSDKEPEAKVV